MVECKHQGLKAEKKKVTESISKVQRFFFLGKSFQGKVYSIKSRCKLVKKSSTSRSDGFKHQTQMQVDNFCDERLKEGCALLSCDEQFAGELMSVLQEDHLVLSSEDFNDKAFFKELGTLFLCDKFNLFLETSNLSETGVKRMTAMVKMMSQLFDNRLRVFLFGDIVHSHLCETRFCSNTEYLCGPSPKRSRVTDDHIEAEIHHSAKDFYGQ